MEKDRDPFNRIEFFIRRLFERIGAVIDFALRRGARAPGGTRTDLSALIPQIERAVETNLRREASRVIAPNLVELRYDYETYTRMGDARRDYLQRELSLNIYEFIFNRRYATLDDVQVKIAYDAFTHSLEIKTGFGEGKEAVLVRGAHETQLAAKSKAQDPKTCEIVLHGKGTILELRAKVASNAEPIGVGRNIANVLVIKDTTISNFHAAFVLRHDEMLELADRDSANGTYVNGVLIGNGGKTIVRDGDRVRFGEVEMMLSVT